MEKQADDEWTCEAATSRRRRERDDASVTLDTVLVFHSIHSLVPDYVTGKQVETSGYPTASARNFSIVPSMRRHVEETTSFRPPRFPSSHHKVSYAQCNAGAGVTNDVDDLLARLVLDVLPVHFQESIAG